MQEDKKIFAGGGMNMDTEERFMNNTDYRYASNCRITSSDEENSGAIENVRGNLPLNFDLVTKGGLNLNSRRFHVIGHYEDKKLNIFYYFVYDNGPERTGGVLDERNHCIVSNYMPSSTGGRPGAWRILLEGQLLNFQRDNLITGVNIIHSDEFAPGGILYWTDNVNPPRKLNVLKSYWWYANPGAITDPNLSYLEDPINLLEAVPKPPAYPPIVSIGTWENKKSNDLKQKLWQFKYRYVYRDGQKSSWSPISASLTTRHTTGMTYPSTVEEDNFIQVEIINGGTEVESMEIAVRRNGTGDDFYLVGTIRKDDSLQENVTLTPYGSPALITVDTVKTIIPTNLSTFSNLYFLFTGEEPRLPIDLQESIKLYDDVPLLSKAQEIVDGNRLVYGNIVNGYDPVPTDCSFDVVYKPTENNKGSVTKINYDVKVKVKNFIYSNYTTARSHAKYKIYFKLPDMGSRQAGEQLVFDLNGISFGVRVKRYSICGDKEGVLVQTVNIGVPSHTYTCTGVDTVNDVKNSLLSCPVEFIKEWGDSTSDDTDVFISAGHGSTNRGRGTNVLSSSHGHTGVNTANSFWDVEGDDIVLKFLAFHDDDFNTLTCSAHQFLTYIGPPVGIVLPNFNYGNIGFTGPTGTSPYYNIPYDGGGVDGDSDSLGSTWTSHTNYNTNWKTGAQANFPVTGFIDNNSALISLPVPDATNNRGFKSGTKHHFGLVYYDSANRSGAVNKAGSIYVPSRHERPQNLVQPTTTNPIGGNVVDYTAHIHFKIKHLPPSWATHYQWVHSAQRIESFVQINAMRIFFDDQFKAKYDTKFPRSQTDGGGTATPGYQPIIDSANTAAQNGAVLMDMEELLVHSAKSSEHNFLWDWKKGDRVKIIDQYKLTGEDFEIIGVFEDVQGDFPSSTVRTAYGLPKTIRGKLYFVLEHGSSGVISNGLEEHVLVEIYRIAPESQDIYNEFNHANPIGLDARDNRVHLVNTFANGNTESNLDAQGFTYTTGAPMYYVDANNVSITDVFTYNQNDTSNPDPDFPAEGTFYNGDVYVRERINKNALNSNLGNATFKAEDFSASDFWPSTAWDIGRPNAFLPEFKQTRREATIFFSEPFVPNTAINGLGTFFPDVSFREYDKSFNSIQKLFSINDRVIIMQEDKVSYALVSRAVLFDASAEQNVAISDSVLSASVPYSGDFGIAKNPESFANFGFRSYFVDAKSRTVLRLSQDGLTPISEHGMKNFFTDYFQEVIDKGRHVTTGFKIYGAYDVKFDEYVMSIPDINWSYEDVYGNTISDEIEGFTIGFNEPSKKWNSFYDYKGNLSVYNTVLHSFSFGILYKHNSLEDANGNPVYNNYYGVQYPSVFEFPVNKFPDATKVFQNISVHSNRIWEVDAFYTRNGQLTDITLEEFTGGNTFVWEEGHGTKENVHYSVIKCDVLTPGLVNPKLEGNRMRDTSAMCRLVLSNPTSEQQTVLFSVAFGFIMSSNPALMNNQ